MLVLSRKENESIIIDSDIEVEVLEIKNGRVRLGIRAPHSKRIVRAEVELRDLDPVTPAPKQRKAVNRRSLSDSHHNISIP